MIPAPRVRSVLEMESSAARQLARMSEIETQIAGLQAEQIRSAATYVREQEAIDSRLGFAVSDAQWRVMVAEVAAARRVSTISAGSWLDDAFTLDDTAPFTLAALSKGEIGLWSARTIARQLLLVEDLGLRRLADEVIAEEAPGLLPGKVAAMAQTRVMTIDPETADARAEQARADKHVTCVAGEPGTAWLMGLLPAEQAAACWHAMHDQATAEYAAGDPAGRSVSHLMCDILVQRLTGTADPVKVKTHVQLVMTEATLLGWDSKPGQLIGVGPIPPALASRIAAIGDTWVTRLFTDPVDGTALVSDTRARRFEGKLRRLIEARDQRCRGPWCPTRIADLDHIVEHGKGGHTSRRNGQGLSKGCHTMRDHPGVTVKSDPESNAVTWKLPSGQTATSLPPPAVGYGTGDRAQVLIRNRITTPPRSRLETQLVDTLIRLRRRPPRT